MFKHASNELVSETTTEFNFVCCKLILGQHANTLCKIKVH